MPACSNSSAVAQHAAVAAAAFSARPFVTLKTFLAVQLFERGSDFVL